MATALPTAAPAQPGLFDQKLPPRLILASFPLLTLPLIIALAVFHDQRLLQVFIVLSLTHFVLTLSVYLQSENFNYFKATARNILLYFAIPLAILMGFYLIAVFEIRSRFPIFGLAFSAIVQFLNFNHLNRQTFGVFQMFKARTGLRLPPESKRYDLGFLSCLTAMLWMTFLGGGICPLLQSSGWFGWRGIAPLAPPVVPIAALQVLFAGAMVLALVFATASLRLLFRAWNSGGRPQGLLEAVGYLGIQTAAASVGMVNFSYFFVTQPTHSVEYHVLMHPRCFRTALNEKSGLDRWFGSLRRNPVIFHGVVILAAGVVMLCMNINRGSGLSLPYRALVSIFEGLFVFHYFVEMLIWRFSDPFFRRTLSSLYFKPRPWGGQSCPQPPLQAAS
jgi:hypothetical protein